MLKHDPVEDTPAFQAIKNELEAKIIAKIGENSGMGYCHLYWETKMDILKKRLRHRMEISCCAKSQSTF